MQPLSVSATSVAGIALLMRAIVPVVPNVGAYSSVYADQALFGDNMFPQWWCCPLRMRVSFRRRHGVGPFHNGTLITVFGKSNFNTTFALRCCVIWAFNARRRPATMRAGTARRGLGPSDSERKPIDAAALN